MNKKLISTLLAMATITSTVGTVQFTKTSTVEAAETARTYSTPEFEESDTNSYYYENLVYKINGSVAEVTGTDGIINNATVQPKINVGGRDYTVSSVTITNVATLASINIPEGVVNVNIDGCSGLTQLNLPSSCTSVSAASCTGLSSVILPENVRNFKFSKCYSLVNVKLPNGLSKIPRASFSYCTALTNIKLPSNLALIEDNAFYHCTSLSSISIPANVSSIGEDAFNECTRLRTVKFNGNTNAVKWSFEDEYNYVTKILVPVNWRGSISRSGLNAANIVYFTPKSVYEAANVVREYSNSRALNTTSESDVINKLNELIGDDENVVSFSTSHPFTKTNATSTETGSITGTVIIDNNDNEVEIPLQIVIDKLPISAAEAKNLIVTKLDYYGIIDNSVTPDMIATDLAADLTNVTVSTVESTINKVEPTTQQTGSLTFDVLITDEDGATETVNVNLTINKLPQTIEEAGDAVSNSVDNIGHLTNNTTCQDIIDAVKGGVTNSNITVDFSEENPFTKRDATSRDEGSITGTLVVSDGTTSQSIPVNVTIPMLAQSVEEAKNEVQGYLNSMSINNDTTAEDILNAIEPGIRNDAISAEFTSFSKIEATSHNEGNIEGVLLIKDANTGDIEQLTVSFNIAQLPQNIDDVKIIVDEVIESTTDTRPNNDSTENSILDTIRNQITNSDITVGFSEDNPFTKTDATSTEEGSITGTIIISDGTTSQRVPVNVTIPRLPQSVNEAADIVKDSLNVAVEEHRFNNSTTAEDIINTVRNGITNSNMNIEFSQEDSFTKTDATSTEEGSITGTIIISDGTTSESIPVNITIPKLENNNTDENHIDEIINRVVDNSNADNNTTPDDIISNISNALGDGYNVVIDSDVPFVKEDATTDNPGSISCGIIVTDQNGNEHKLNINIAIDL